MSEKHFVRFFSPGTMFAEISEQEIASWDVDKAVELAKGVVERYGAKPYGFRFSTVSKMGTDWDVKTETTATSSMYYLGGQVFTLAEVEARNNPDESILISNMTCNGYDRIIENNNSWKSTQPFSEGDVLLDVQI